LVKPVGSKGVDSLVTGIVGGSEMTGGRTAACVAVIKSGTKPTGAKSVCRAGEATPLSGLVLCLLGGDIPEGGMEQLTIVVSFDVGEQWSSHRHVTVNDRRHY
jgi:hypothetical protein